MASAMRIAPTCLITCSIHRPKLDFSENEVGRLKLLAPHLASAFRHSRAFDNLKKKRDFLSRTRTFGLIVLDRKGKIKVISELAAGLLEIFFSDFEHDVLPEELGLFVDEQNARLAGREYFGPADVLRIRRQDSELQIRLAFDFNSDELKLFIEDKKDLSPDDLSSLGLTRRETEVMYLICKGKTDETVGRICGINVRTVQKHVENIFTKLGVETRTAAMSYALENTRR